MMSPKALILMIHFMSQVPNAALGVWESTLKAKKGGLALDSSLCASQVVETSDFERGRMYFLLP